MTLTTGQCEGFKTFGYVVIPGLLSEEIDWITSEFHAVFKDKGMEHDGSRRSVVVPFIDQREKLCTLLDNQKVTGTIGSLLGQDFNYIGGDGNMHSGDTAWHTDGGHQVGLYAKFHIYLDSLTHHTGALRVIPGSHLHGTWREQLRQILEQPADDMGINGADIPCVTVETNPGDVLIFNHNIYHAAFGGGTARRHVAMNISSRAKTPNEIKELDEYIPRHCLRKGGGQVHSDLMRETASPTRMCYLEQPIKREKLLVSSTPGH